MATNIYFLWDRNTRQEDIERILAKSWADAEKQELAGRFLNEARYEEVWKYFSPREVAEHYEAIRPYLSRRKVRDRALFWDTVIKVWRKYGFV